MSPRLSRLTSIVELAGSIAIFLFGLWIWLHIFTLDMAHGAHFTLRKDAPATLMLVAPGTFVAIGAYLQTLHRKRWAVAVVLIGCMGALIFLGVNAAFVFLYSGDKLGQRLVFTDLFVVAIILGAALINAFAPKERASALGGTQPKSLDASGGGVFRNLIRPAMLE